MRAEHPGGAEGRAVQVARETAPASSGPVAVHARVDGPADGPPIVLSNSLGTTLEMWDPQVPALVEAGYRVLRYDTRGHGRSPVPPGPYSMDQLGADLLAVLDRHGVERAHVAGVSLGGATAMWMAVNAPRRVDRLIVCCSAARFGEPDGWHERAATVRERGMGPVAATIPERWFTPAYVEACPEVVDPIVATLAATAPDGYAACCEAIAGIDLREAIAAVRAPTLVLAGADDPATPPDNAREIAATIPGATIYVLAQAAHLASVQCAETVNDFITDFLDQGEHA
jgi:3-oxoadipate enol-lactonase